MAAEYDRKFEEMKKYVPFLESMIKRLESTTTGSTNPRQAQLDKIRSLRDLLMDKKKRMKMDNLLKCEQVLVNLYAKVEQKDTFSIPSNSSETTSLEVVRNKLKTVINKEDEENPETLPEIARANESQDNSTAGSKEPALFQRRPNRASSPGRSVTRSPPGSVTKRNYTRVLVSPEPSSNRWLKSEYAVNDNKPLFNRRSPRWSPNRCSPEYNRKERKKSFKQGHSPRKSKDLNITLKVPEERLNSLNTKDILSRILNCNDNDVDIDSLRVLRSQILGELEHTGFKDDISDLILNSTRNKKKKKKKPKHKEEVEEGELSDSQSEAIEDIYGSVVIFDKDQNSGQTNVLNNEEQKPNRKIQIRLVINSETAAASTGVSTGSKTLNSDVSDFEMYKSNNKTTEANNSDTKTIITDVKPADTKQTEDKEIITVPSREAIVNKSHSKNENTVKDIAVKDVKNDDDQNVQARVSNANNSCSTENNLIEPKNKEGVPFKLNFYTPLIELESNSSEKTENLNSLSANQNCNDVKKETNDPKTEASGSKTPSNTTDSTKDGPEIVKNSVVTKAQDSVEIPLLNEPSVATQKPKESIVSEIDILQALKNEILSESLPGTNIMTPALHQPKLAKVVNANEIAPKKRISIEKYKEKSVSSATTPLFTKGRSMSKEDHIKRQSLKLTEKEFERFKFALHRDLSSDDDDNDIDNTSLDDIYGDLAPKSPDNDEGDLTDNPPIIIPEDPVKNVVVSSKSDVDMRTLMPIVSPRMNSESSLNSLPSPSTYVPSSPAVVKDDHIKSNVEKKAPVDPRLKRNLNQINTQNESDVPRPVPPVNFSSLTPAIAPGIIPSMTSGIIPNMTPDIIPNMTPSVTPCMTANVMPNMTPSMIPNMTPSMIPNMTPSMIPNMTPSMIPNMTPSMIPNMTPSRMPNMTPSMTPNSRSFQIDDQPVRKHVYATLFDPRDYRDQSVTRDVQTAARDKSEKSKDTNWELREDNTWNDNQSWQDRAGRSNSVQTDTRDYQKYHKYNESYHYYKYKNSTGDRADAPSTPSHPFGGHDCPTTPSHSFGRSDYPPTPSHSFGRSDCPSTPSHSFGRADCPPTPSHSFGRSDCPPTPSRAYTRSDCPVTPSHSFGRSERPQTPIHSYGRPDGSLTPSHSFGRSECPPTPSSSFGRTDITMTQSRSLSRMDRDPRLKRSVEYESNTRNDDRNRFQYDRDRIHYKDSNASMYNSYHKDKSYTDTYRNYRERSFGQNERNQRYSKDYDNSMQERISRSDKYGGEGRSEKYETDEKYAKSHKSDVDYNEKNKPMMYNEMEPKHNIRERSVGRNVPSEERFVRSNSRARSVGRNNESDVDNTLSIKSHYGRPFTIDTSVNSTFQNLIKKRDKDKSVFDHIFDNRKQRANSVGRSLVRETSVGPTQSRSFNPTQNNEGRNNSFRRARSVMREIEDSKPNQTFSEVKADFEAFKTKLNSCTKFKKHDLNFCAKPADRNESPRNRKINYEVQDKKPTSKKPITGYQPSYSPRKNHRDPRLHRDKYYDMKNRHKDDKYKYSDLRDKKKYGIDYSNESIARGTLLETGFGVKNYKIPKIKRVNDEDLEKKAEVKAEVSKEKKIENSSNFKVTEKIKPDKNIIIKSKNSKPSDSSFEKKEKHGGEVKLNINDSEKKITRSSKKYFHEESKLSDDEIIPKTQKPKRRIRDSESEAEDTTLLKLSDDEINVKTQKHKRRVRDSESEAEETTANKDVETEKPCIDKTRLTQSNENKNETIAKGEQLEKNDKNKNENRQNVELDTSFAEDLEIFADNAVSDPVIDSINALIADLDDDINTSKNDGGSNFRKEIFVENMLENITSQPEEDNSKESSEDVTLQDINEFIREDLNKSEETANGHKAIESSIKAVEGNTIAEMNSQCTEKLPPFDKFGSDYAEKNKMLTTTSVIKENEEIETEVSKTHTDSLNEQVSSKDNNNEDIVSTTDTESEQSNKLEVQNKDNQTGGNCLTPDSTYSGNIPTKLISDETFPDSSTNEVQNENPDVTSSHDSSEDKAQKQTEATTNKNETSDVDSIESILFLLKNKAKMKEILSKLEQQSCDNDKVKKKLEKLSEIVSADEDSDDEEQKLSKMNKKESICEDILTLSEKNDNTDNKNKNSDNVSSILEETGEHSDLVENEQQSTEMKSQPSKNISVKKGKNKRKRNSKLKKKNMPKDGKRMTRSEAASLQKVTPKNRGSRELLKLQEDIKEMFISDDILNATGIRMCRLAKLVDEKVTAQKGPVTLESKPVVVLEKVNKQSLEESHLQEETKTTKVIKKKPGPKLNALVSLEQSSADVETKVEQSRPVVKYKPGPKSKKKSVVNQQAIADPYAFETDSINESNASKRSDDSPENSSDSEDESLTSLKSYGSSEVLAEIKRKPKRKKSAWMSGVIKPKHKKKKIEQKADERVLKGELLPKAEKYFNIPDFNCFTDKAYCFIKNVTSYSCRLCVYSGDDIVAHYKKHHPHSEIPLSRLSPEIAKEAIHQCEQINIQAISKILTKRLVCRFCYKEFMKKKSSLEAFFWHVVSTHTGEYKQLCSECINITRCPFNLDIPPPPKDLKGQLIGYICGKCNFTQISLENLKTHVIVRHNDEQTEVYTINLAVMSRKLVNILLNRTKVPETDQPRVLRSTRSNQSMTETSDDRSDYTDTNEISTEPSSPQIKRRTRRQSDTTVKSNMQSKIIFENDDSTSETTVKMEREDQEEENQEDTSHLGEDAIESDTNANEEPAADEPASEEATVQRLEAPVSDDIFAYPHFKICYTDTGSKEFVCCINGHYHYKTTLLISIKKHVQHKHNENWDGYCFVCKVIVMPQGRHHFRDCLEHFLDKHMGEFPVMEKVTEPEKSVEPPASEPEVPATPSPRPYINVRPISQLKDPIVQDENSLGLPKIECVVSLGGPSEQNLNYSAPDLESLPPQSVEDFNKYEQAQVEVMSKKHPVVLDTMLRKEKLVKVFKCAGSYCSFTTDSADVALIHALCHQQIGGENAMNCAYCDFDTENAIDLVVHVFKHATCQIACGYCFYRAVCGQLVAAHAKRAHPGKPTKVLSATKSVVPEKDTSQMLPRHVVVKYYVCNQAETDSPCTFRTFIANKFCEHVEQQHPHVTEHICYICFATVSSAAQLIEHMKSHDMNYCQCAWCPHAADDENSLLNHSSAKHPTKPPQAYLRRITKKGPTEFRVLPLVCINPPVHTEIVVPNSTSENPTKEAERSLELEKLIGTTKAMFENMTSTSQTQDRRDGIETFDLDAEIAAESLFHQDCSLTTSPVTTAAQKIKTPVTENPVSQNIVTANPVTENPVAQSSVTQEKCPTSLSHTTEVIANKTPSRVSTPVTNSVSEHVSAKVEPQAPVRDTQPAMRHSEAVVCVESDEESLRQTVIDLSDDEDFTESTPTAIPPTTSTVDPQSKPTANVQSTSILDVQTSSSLSSKTTTTVDKQIAPIMDATHSLTQIVVTAGPSKQLEPASSLKESVEKTKFVDEDILFKCPKCKVTFKSSHGLKKHILSCYMNHSGHLPCVHCGVATEDLIDHYINIHQPKAAGFMCGICDLVVVNLPNLKRHLKNKHKVVRPRIYNKVRDGEAFCVGEASAADTEAAAPRQAPKRKSSTGASEQPQKLKRYGPQDVDQLPINPILDELVWCSLCEFKTKVRLNLVRHLQLHADQQPVPQTAPVNPVPHLETNEMHFDKMVNLASSSIVTRVPEKQTRPDVLPVVSLHIPPEAASRYPKYVPERQRHTCGAKGCSYISVDEAMLRCHWDTLHSGSNDFHCVHCPPYQHLDTSKPLTAARIIAHLKMHDTTLYACSSCNYYHYRRQVLEKHVNEVHKSGQLMVVREEAISQSSSTGNVAPTMDLKPWKCGLCRFKSMLRAEVVEHCAKVHQSKMQYKCSYCPFRTSTLVNVVKHQSNSHPGKPEEVVYYYYREGSVPEEVDGTPRWMKQREKTGTTDTEVKTEVPDNTSLSSLPAPPPPVVNIDLNIVKKEVDASSPGSEQGIEELCKMFGEFCEPNGLKYKCCLCNVVTEDTKEAMQSHMYEELQYRKWRCSVCSYKAFHKTGLHDHMISEHRGQVQNPVELPVDANIEKWVSKMLEHQSKIIDKNKENFAKQKIQVPTPSTSKVLPKPQAWTQENSSRPKPSMKELEQAFGQLGVANNMQFCCPKCVFRNKDENVMKDHLEGELSKIRWGCSVCSQNFTTYHEVQFHCKSVHDGQSARPKEAIRDPTMRAAWVAAVIQVQKLSMNCMPIEPLLQPSPQKQPPEDNSLLVVRFEESVPIPEGAAKKRPLPQSPDSDEERLIIDEVAPKRAFANLHKCQHCSFQSKYSKSLKSHIFKHYNMLPYGCQHCEFTGLTSSKIFAHIRVCHPNKPLAVKSYNLPSGPPLTLHVHTRRTNTREDDLRGCMICNITLSEAESLMHKHSESLAIFAKHGDIVYRCSICLHVRKDMYSMQIHCRIKHPSATVNYTKDQVRLYQGEEASAKVQFVNYDSAPIDLDDSTSHSEDSTFNAPPPKRIAKKSTTKLPMQAVARKSTTKLPLYSPPDCEEYSYYGTKPTPLNEYANVTTMMSFCNTMVPFTMQKLSEIINIQPNVRVKDNNKK